MDAAQIAYRILSTDVTLVGMVSSINVNTIPQDTGMYPAIVINTIASPSIHTQDSPANCDESIINITALVVRDYAMCADIIARCRVLLDYQTGTYGSAKLMTSRHRSTQDGPYGEGQDMQRIISEYYMLIDKS